MNADEFPPMQREKDLAAYPPGWTEGGEAGFKYLMPPVPALDAEQMRLVGYTEGEIAKLGAAKRPFGEGDGDGEAAGAAAAAPRARL